uniref:Putative salivary secreted cytotoxin n=1 Tax=Ixodes scapularis TaxID=6945 RepID=A0A4D5S475_IXOSC
MASSLPFHLAVALLLLLVHQHAAEGLRAFDFDKKVASFVEDLSKTHKQKVMWWDIHGEHKRIQENLEKYGQYKVSVTAEAVKYGAAKIASMTPNVAYTQWAHNGQPSSAQQVSVKRRTQRVKSATWQTQTAFSSSFNLKAAAKISAVTNFQTQVQAALDLKTARGGPHSETEEFTVHEVVNVPPMKSVKIEWIIPDVVQDIPWTAEVIASGWVALWFENKVDNPWMWFYPVSSLRDPLLRNIGNNSVQFSAKGVLPVSNAQEGHLRVTEFDLQQYAGKPSPIRTYPIPLKLTQ